MRLRLRAYLRRKSKKGLTGLAIIAVGVVSLMGGGVYAALGGFGTQTSTSDIALQSGLIGWWQMNGNAKDSTPYAHNGTFTGSPTLVADRKGKASSAYSFDGTGSNYITTATTVPVTLVSVSAWIKTAVTSTNLAVVGTTNLNGFYFRVGSNNRVQVLSEAGGGACGSTGATVSSGVWTHVAFTYDSTGNCYVYLNGAQVGTATAASMASFTAAPAVISCFRTCQEPFNGSIDDVRIYNRVLSAVEVAALYKAYDPGIASGSGENGLVGWWKFDGNAKDSTPRANVGTINGTTTLTTDRKGVSNTAYSFAGASTSYISTTTTGLPDPGTAWTGTAWIYPTNSSGTIMELDNTTGGEIASLRIISGSLEVIGNAGLVKLNTGSNIALNQWHHVTYSFVGGSGNHPFCIYLDGSQLSCNSASIDGTTGAANLFYIGKNNANNSYFNGSIDDVRMYNRVLSASEITTLYNSYNSQISLNSSPTNGTTGNFNSGLIAYWPMNGNSKDATPYANNGVATGNVLATTDRKGRANSAYVFDGATGERFSLPGTGLYQNFGTNNFSVSSWVKTTESGTSRYIIGNTSSTGSGWRFGYNSNGKALYYIGDGTNSSLAGYGSITLNDGNWHLLTQTFTYSGVTGWTLVAYIDGVSSGSVTLGTIGSIGSTNVGYIGSGGPLQTAITGSLDDVRIWNRALSASEVTALYRAYY